MTSRINKNALKHLSLDPVMKELIKSYDVSDWYDSERDLFTSLVRNIVGQQLSGKAADTIYSRVVTIIGDPADPHKIIKIKAQKLREQGMSFAKITYIKDLSNKVITKTLNVDNLRSLSDDEITVELCKVKGIGPWTAEMFLMFTLNRPDIFSMGDLGLKTAISKLYGVDRSDFLAIEKISNKWSPHRSLASRYLWRSLENSQ